MASCMKALNFPVWLLTICMMAAALAPERALAQNRLTMEPPPRVRLKVAAQPDGRGMIKFGTPQVYSRQVVFRDRTEEIQYLSDRLKKAQNLTQSLQGIVDTRDYQALGILLELAQGTAPKSSSGGQESKTAATGGDTEGDGGAGDPPSRITKPDVKTPSVLTDGGAAAKTTSAVLTPIEQEKAVIELRRFLQNERRRLNFDDMHDATGAVAVDLGMLVTLVPPAGEDAYAIIEAYALPPGHGQDVENFRKIERALSADSGKAGYEESLWLPTYEKVNPNALMDEHMRKAWADYLLSAIQAERDFIEMRVMSTALPFGEKHFQLAVDELRRQVEERNRKESGELAAMLNKDREEIKKKLAEAQRLKKEAEQKTRLKELLQLDTKNDLLSAKVALEEKTVEALKQQELSSRAWEDLQMQGALTTVAAATVLPVRHTELVNAVKTAFDEHNKVKAAEQTVEDLEKRVVSNTEATVIVEEELREAVAAVDQAAQEVSRAQEAAAQAQQPVEKQLGLTLLTGLTSPVMESSRAEVAVKESQFSTPAMAAPASAEAAGAGDGAAASEGAGRQGDQAGATPKRLTPAQELEEMARKEAAEEKDMLFYRYAVRGGLSKLDLYKSREDEGALMTLVQDYKQRLMALYLKLYFDRLIPASALTSGNLGELQLRQCDLEDNACVLLDQMRELNPNAVRVLSVDPADQGQNISNVGATQSISDIVLSLAPLLPDSKVSGQMDYYRDNRQFLQSANRKPVAVGFVNGDAEFPSFGWILGPRFEVKLKKPFFGLWGRPRAEAGYKHEPTQHQVQVSLGMMAWMPGLELELRGHWVSKRTGLPVTPILTSCHVPVKMTPDYAALTEGMLDMLHGRRRPPRILITNHKEKFTLSSQGTTHKLVLLGKDMWRSPAVSLDSLPADSVEVLPGLTGVVATFNGSLPPAYDALYDVTITTTDGYDVIYNRVAAPVRGGQLGAGGSGAAPGVRFNLAESVVEVSDLANAKSVMVTLRQIENRFPMPAQAFLKGGFFPAGVYIDPMSAELIGGQNDTLMMSVKFTGDDTLASKLPGLLPAGQKNGAARLGLTLGMPVMDAAMNAPTRVNVIEGSNTVLLIDRNKSKFEVPAAKEYAVGLARAELLADFPQGMPAELFAEAYGDFVAAAAKGELRLNLKLASGTVVPCFMTSGVSNLSAGLRFALPTLDEVLAQGVELKDDASTLTCDGEIFVSHHSKSFGLNQNVVLKLPAKPKAAD